MVVAIMAQVGTPQELDELLSRGVTEFVDPDGSFREKLARKARGEYASDIIIKFGVDPTRPDIHIGHAVALRKLRTFQNIGCKVVFLIGDYTTEIGDPTGKTKARPEINRAEIVHNMKTFLEQVGRVLDVTDPKKYDWIPNSVWYQSVVDYGEGAIEEKVARWKAERQEVFGRFGGIVTTTLYNFMSTLRKITHAQLIERDMFRERIESGNELYMHEMMYPVLQGIDSTAIARLYGSCDLEIGGADQTFNMLMGRTIMKRHDPPQAPQSVMSVELLLGTDGTEKMSKSLDNYIALGEEPAIMYGKIMSIPDALIMQYFTLSTYTPVDELRQLREDLTRGALHPRDAKMRLAREIVEIYHGPAKRSAAEEEFIRTFVRGETPKDCVEIKGARGTRLDGLLVAHKVVSSKSEFRRLVSEGAIEHMETKVKVHDPFVSVGERATYRVGASRFVRVVPE